jgi:hypothetical protein
MSHYAARPAGWDSQPRRLGAAGRVVKLGWFTGQPAGLLTALCGSSGPRRPAGRPPGTAEADALAAMDLAAQASNLIHAPDILAAVAGHPALPEEAEPGWRCGSPRAVSSPAARRRDDRAEGRRPGRHTGPRSAVPAPGLAANARPPPGLKTSDIP